MTKRHWRDGQNDDENEKVGRACCAPTDGKVQTIQSGKDDADINVLVRRFGLGEGPLAPPPKDPAHYGDFTNAPTSLREILDIKRSADEAFAQLPARMREYFHNDPAVLWGFVNDPKNREEAVEMGLLHKHVPAPIIKEQATQHTNQEDDDGDRRIRITQKSPRAKEGQTGKVSQRDDGTTRRTGEDT